jgi:hypothetical protein
MRADNALDVRGRTEHRGEAAVGDGRAQIVDEQRIGVDDDQGAVAA